MKVIVDLDICEANGNCMEHAPRVFNLDDKDVLHVLMVHPEPADHDNVFKAENRCPRQAITIEE